LISLEVRLRQRHIGGNGQRFVNVNDQRFLYRLVGEG
jgi:hypothetical protein